MFTQSSKYSFNESSRDGPFQGTPISSHRTVRIEYCFQFLSTRAAAHPRDSLQTDPVHHTATSAQSADSTYYSQASLSGSTVAAHQALIIGMGTRTLPVSHASSQMRHPFSHASAILPKISARNQKGRLSIHGMMMYSRMLTAITRVGPM